MNVNFLMPLDTPFATKEFLWENNKWNLTKSYKSGKYFKGFEIEINSLSEFYELLLENQEYPVFMIHGGIIDGTNKERMLRKKRGDKPTICNRMINLFCLDVDGFEGTIDQFLERLPIEFQESSYVYQYSSSYGLTSDKLKCHFFFWLDTTTYNNDIENWINSYNALMNWGKILDPAPLRATQPVYTQKRICKGAIDPIENFIGFVDKGQNIESLPIVTEINDIELPIANNKLNKNDFDIKNSIEKILKSESFHDEIRSTALSLANKKIPVKTIKALIEGAMNSIENKDERWQARYDDIDRAIESALDIVNNPSVEDILNWIFTGDQKEVRIEFATKILNLNPLDRATALQAVCDRLNFKISDVKRECKVAEEEALEEQRKAAIEARSIERKMNKIFEVEITATNANEVVDKVNRILSKSKKDPQVFYIGGMLAKVGLGIPKTIRQISKKDELGKDYPKIPIIIPYRKPYYSLLHRVQKDIVFQTETKKDIEPPTKIIHEVGQAEYAGFKPLSGIVENPFFNHDWKIVQKEGYNEKTGLFTMLHHKLKIKKMKFDYAWRYLSEVVLDEFPFQSDLDLAVTIACLMTCTMRPTISADTAGMPGFGIVSPVQSSGKTTLAQLISNSIFNRPIASTSWTDNEEELGKHLLAILQEGHSCVIFDNIKQGCAVKSEKLSSAMSSDVFAARQLGENKNVEVPSSVIWMFTGNGISFVGDFATRIYPININARMSDPNTRKFKRNDVGQWAMDNRKHILSAVLSIIYAGRDLPEMKTGSRFQLWDKFVRRPIYKVSGIDINDAILINQKSDPEKLVKDTLLTCLYETFKHEKFTTKDIIRQAFGSFETEENELSEALIDYCGDKAKNTMSLGRYLSAIVGGVYNNLIIEKTMSNYSYWQIIKSEI